VEREVRYCTTDDGVRIAYCIEGVGPPVLIFPFFLESFGRDHLFPRFVEVLRLVARGRQIIRFDTRGSGLSQREVTDFSRDALFKDVIAVLNATGEASVAIAASSIGGIRALDFALRVPERVERMALWSTFSRINDVFPEETLNGLAALAKGNWDLCARAIADLGIRRQSEELGLQLAELYKESMTGDVVARLIAANATLDITSDLTGITAPTLLIYGMDDPLYPMAVGQRLAAAIPNARFLPMPGITSAIFFDDDAAAAANAFLNEGLPDRSDAPHISRTAEAGLRTILFTDLVRHTEMMSRLGDERGREVLREHERITREVLKAYDGTEVKTMGDGFMASFGSVTKAVECAIALQRAFADRGGEPLNVRVGLNAGEPIEEDGDLFGATVILASRIAARAGAGEIFVADTVRGLCSGKGFLFSDRGDFVAKGFEEPMRVYEVSWSG
jgi:class 3 adenylate cyclase/pimeloyl-ACP methyl ester carboxylesterase